MLSNSRQLNELRRLMNRKQYCTSTELVEHVSAIEYGTERRNSRQGQQRRVYVSLRQFRLPSSERRGSFRTTVKRVWNSTIRTATTSESTIESCSKPMYGRRSTVWCCQRPRSGGLDSLYSGTSAERVSVRRPVPRHCGCAGHRRPRGVRTQPLSRDGLRVRDGTIRFAADRRTGRPHSGRDSGVTKYRYARWSNAPQQKLRRGLAALKRDDSRRSTKKNDRVTLQRTILE